MTAKSAKYSWGAGYYPLKPDGLPEDAVEEWYRAVGYRDEDTLRDLYLVKGMSQRDIAERFGVSKSTIRRWVLEFGLSEGGPKEHAAASWEATRRRILAKHGLGPDV